MAFCKNMFRITTFFFCLLGLVGCKSKSDGEIVPFGQFAVAKFTKKIPAASNSDLPERIMYMRALFKDVGVLEDEQSKFEGDRLSYYLKQRIKGMSKDEAIKCISDDYVALVSYSKHPNTIGLSMSEDPEKQRYSSGVYSTKGSMMGIFMFQGIEPYALDLLEN